MPELTKTQAGRKPGSLSQVWQRHVFVAIGCLVALLGVAETSARQPHGADPALDPPPRVVRDGFDKPDRKRPSRWRRPSEPTARRQLALARMRAGQQRYRAAAKAADRLVRQWHNAPQAVEAQLLLARMLEQRGRLPAAFEAYQYLIVFYPGRFDYAEVVESQFQIAESLRQRLSRRFAFGPGIAAVRGMYAQVIRNAPFGPRAAEAQMAVASLYEEENELDAAVLAYERLDVRYPDHPLALESAFRAAECRARLAMRHPRDEALALEALAAVHNTLRAHPQHPETASLRQLSDALYEHIAALHLEQAEFYDRIQNNPDAARIAYSEFLRRFPDSRHAAVAQKRLRKLQSDDNTTGRGMPTPDSGHP